MDRYDVQEGAETVFTRFKFSVVDNEKRNIRGKREVVCECPDIDDARAIANSLNSAHLKIDAGVPGATFTLDGRTYDVETVRTALHAHDRPELAVWCGPMPESNGRANWSAILYRKAEGFLSGPSICIERSEYPNRVRYEADRLRYIIGEIDAEPDILAYDGNLHSGYTGPQPFDLLAHLQRQREFSERTFGPGARTAGLIDHIRKELLEIEADPGDLAEWIDVAILALDGAWRTGASPQQIIDALVAKQVKNEGRTWPDWRTAPADKAIEHDRSGEVQP